MVIFWDPIVKKAKRLWTAWDIQTLVLLSLTFQIILLVFGRRRSYITGFLIRTTVWSSYLMASWVATVGIGKLSDISVGDPSLPNTETSLKALLAPILLLHLGSPDTITAYSIQDNQLGAREIVETVAQVGLVIWILIRCWTYTRLSFLTLPIFLAGFIKYGERAWALKSALDQDADMAITRNDEENTLPEMFCKLPKDNPGADLILKAFYRFDRIKPHLKNWIYHSLYISRPSLSIDNYPPIKVFKITEIELGFMYNALYTKTPIIYTKVGFMLRFLTFVCIALTFSGFAVMFRKDFLHHKDVTFTFSMLAIAMILELDSDSKLLFSDRAVVWAIRHQHQLRMERLLNFLVRFSLAKQRWSNRLPQFNLLCFCHKPNSRNLMSKILKYCQLEEEWKKHRFLTYKEKVPIPLQELVLREIKAVEGQRGFKPFTKRGEWALERHNFYEEVKSTIRTDFGRSITIWHIATSICYQLDDANTSEGASLKEMSKWVSDYMMHLLVNLPEMLSVASGHVIYKHVCTVIKELQVSTPEMKDEHSACQILQTAQLPDHADQKPEDPVIELGWLILPEAQQLSGKLLTREQKWEIISSVWTEMLCYAAYNCDLDSHAQQLRRGGEFITLIWLLLAHKTDRFNFGKCG